MPHIFIIGLCFFLVSCAKQTYLQNDVQSGSGDFTYACDLKMDTTGYCLDWQWEVLPTETSVGSFIIKIYRPNLLDGSPVLVDLDTSLSVVLWMSSMNHGSSPVFVEHVDTGTFRANRVFFIMPGDWQIRFQFKKGDQLEEELIADIFI